MIWISLALAWIAIGLIVLSTTMLSSQISEEERRKR